MNSLYNNLNEKKFKIITIISCFLADLFVIVHLVISLGNKEQFQLSLDMAMKIMAKQSPDMHSKMPPNFVSELWQVMITTTISIIVIYMLFHSVIYLMHHYNKGFARGYIKLYAWSAGILMGLFALTNFTSLDKVIFLIPSVLLLFVAIGMKRFPGIKKTEE